MSVKLFYALFSPPSRSVMVMLKLLNVPHELKEVELLKGEHFTPEYLKMNPQHSVPVLDDNGFFVLDSHAINAYLVGAYGKDDKWYPKDTKMRSVIDHRLHFDTGVLFQTYRNVIRGYKFKTLVGLTKEIVKEFEDAYRMMEGFLKNYKFIASDEATIADISAFTSLVTMEILWPVDPSQFPLLTSYLERCRTNIPYLSTINESGTEAIKKVLRGFNYKL